MKKITKKGIAILLALGFAFTSLPSTMVSFAESTAAEESKVTSFVFEDEELYAKAELSEADALPDGTKFVVKQVSADSDNEFDLNVYYWANDVLNASLDRAGMLPIHTFFYDMYFEYEGERKPINNEFQVHLAYKQDKILDPEASSDNVRVYHLDDNEVTGLLEAADTNANLDVNVWGAVNSADFVISHFRYTPFMISMVETKEAHDARMAALEETATSEDAAAIQEEKEEHIVVPDDAYASLDENLRHITPDEDDTNYEDDLITTGENVVEEDTSYENDVTDTPGPVIIQTEDEQGDENADAAEGTDEEISEETTEGTGEGTEEGDDGEEAGTRKVIYMDDEEEEDTDAESIVITTEDTEDGQEEAETAEQTDGEEGTEEAETSEQIDGEDGTEEAETSEQIDGEDEKDDAEDKEASEEEETTEAENKEDAENTEETEEEAEAEPEPTRTYYSSWGSDISITVLLSDPSQVPDNAEIVVTPVTPDNSEFNYDAYLEALNNSGDGIDYTSENTLLYDISFVEKVYNEEGEVIDQIVYEPAEGTVKVIIRFNHNQLSNEISAEDSEEVTVNHLVTDAEADAAEVSADEIEVVGVDANVKLEGTDTVTFSTESFSMYSFTKLGSNRGGVDDPIPGGGQETTDLNELVTEVSITTSSGESVIEEGNRIVTTKNETYNLKFVFQETDALQYDNYETLVYHVPEGVIIKDPGSYEFDVTIGTRVITGNTYEIVTNADGTQEIRFHFNTAHKNFRYINTSPDVEITRIFTAEFTNTTSYVEFGADGTFGYSTQVEDRHNAKVKKTGGFDPNDRKMHYKVVIQSEYGDSENVNVKDILSGSALTNAMISSVYYSDAEGNYSGNYANGYTDNQAQNGFDITLNKVEKDRCVTVEYTADVDFTKIANNGNAIFSETGNTVNITVPGDSDTSDNTATHEEKGIWYSSVTKVSTATSDVQEEDGRKFRIVTWKVVANKEQMVSLGGSSITDKLLNNNEVEYYGNGITVTKVLGQTAGTPTEVSWADVGVTDLVNAESWSYPVVDNDLASYEITYQTKVDITGWTQGRELVNAAKTKYAEDTAKVYIDPPQGQETVEKKVTVNKSATTVGAETITWKIAVNIPANQGYKPLVIEDTVPSIYNTYSDYVESVTVDGEGITDSDYTYQTTEKWAWVDGEHVRIGDDKLTITFDEIVPSENNRTINITVVTRNNPDWMEQAETREDMAAHENTVQVFPNNEPGASDTDKVTPKQKEIIKTYLDEHRFEYYQGVNEDNNPIKIADVPIFRFTVTVTGVDSEPVEIDEQFDSSIFELLDYQAVYNQYADYLDISYGNYSWQGDKTHKAYLRDGKIILDDLPRTAGNAYYGYYNVTVYLYVKPEKLDEFKALIAEEGTPVPGDNITGKQYTFTNVVEWDGARDTAEFTARVENLLNKSGSYNSDTGKYHYTITFNPDKLQVNRNINYDLTDNLRGAVIDRNSISVTATAVDGSQVEARVYASETAAANDTEFEGIQVVYPDNATTLSIYEIPDKTSIVVTYDALPSGEAAIDTNSKKAIVETGNMVTVLDYTYSVSARHEYDFISKTKTEGENGSRTFTIDLNPAKLKVNSGNAYELTDTYTGNLSIVGETPASIFTITADPATATVGGESVNVAEYIISHTTKTESTYSFMIPDQVHVTISYVGNLDFQTGADGTVSAHYTNTAESKDIPVEIDENIESRILTKNAGELGESGDDAGYIPFEIVFNPLGQILNGNETIELKDSYTNLLVDYSSIRISTVPEDRVGLVEYDYTGTVGTYHVPDGTKIILSYRARPDFSKSTTVEWSNTVTAAGYQDGEEGTEVFSSEGSGRGSLGNLLWLYKYEEGHMERPLNNVTFDLYMDVNGTMTPVTRTDGSQVTFTTGNDQERGDGYIFMSLEKKDGIAVMQQFQDANGFKEDTIYYLKETAPVEGFYENEEIYNFVLHEGQESTYIKPSYKSGETIYLFGKEDIVKITNTRITDSIAVSKKWINADGTTTWPAGIQNVTVKIRKKTGNNDPVDMTGANVPAYYWDSENNEVIAGADGSEWNDTIMLTASNANAEWKNLDEDENVTYIVTEIAVNGEPITGDSFTIGGHTYEVITGPVKNGRAVITNAEKTSVSVTKEWGEDFDPSDYSVKVKLIQKVDGARNEAFTIAGQEKTLNSSGWTASWSDLPITDSDGHLLTYDVEETGVYRNSDSSTNLIGTFSVEKTQDQDGNYTITNTPDHNDWHLDVRKIWKDENDQVVTGDSIQFQLIRNTAGSDSSSSDGTGDTVNVYVRNDHNADYSNIGLSLQAIPGSKVRFSIDHYTFDMGGYSATEYLEVYYWDTVTNPNWHHWSKLDSYDPMKNDTQVDITVVDSNMCILLKGNPAPEAELNAAHISLVSLQPGGNSNAGSAVLKPNSSGNGYEVDSTGNYTFTVEPGKTVRINNLPYQSEDGTETYTYTVNETTTGDFTTSVTYSGGSCYDPAPASEGGSPRNGTAHIVNKNNIVQQKGSLKITKKVTVGGEPWTDNNNPSPADGEYTFRVYSDPSCNTQVGDDVSITIVNGQSATEEVENLTPGTYYVKEIGGDNNAVSMDNAVRKVVVEAGVTGEEVRAIARITNNYPVTGKIIVAKRWYNAYGNYEEDVTIPVTVDIYKRKNGSTEKIYEDQSIIPGQINSFPVDDLDAAYYVVEKDTPDGFRARYTTSALDQSTDMSIQNLEERFLGKVNGSDVQVSSGGIIYIMNTPPQEGGQIEIEKKWIEFKDPNGQQSPRPLDGANTTDSRKKYMMIRGQYMYDAYDREGNRLTATSQPATEVFDLWTSFSGRPFTDDNNVNNTIFIRNLIIDGWTCLINKDNNSIWLFSEYTGSGWENGVSGQLPASGYMNNQIVDYRYHFVETGVYDVSDWENPVDETDEWWVTWVEASQYLNNPSDRTTIVNRKKGLGKINIQKNWGDDEDLDAQAVLLKVYRYVWNTSSGVDITSELMGAAETHGLNADDFTADGSYIKVKKSKNWKLTIDKLPLGIPNGTDQLETCYYYIQEVKYIDVNGEEQDIPTDWTVAYSGSQNGTGEQYIGGKKYILAAPRTQNTETLYVSNTIPTGEITVTKQWKDAQGNDRLPEKDEEKVINFKLFYTYEDEDEQIEYTDGREEGQEYYTIRYTSGTSVTDQDETETQGQGSWSEFKLSDLPIYKVVTNADETKTVKKVAGYSVVEQTDSGAAFTVTYKVGNGDAVENQSTPVLNGDVTIINTDKDAKGKIHVSKTFSGISELPEGFKITAAWSEDESPIELTVNDEDSRSVGGLTVTMTSVPAAEGTDASYTWTIEGLPIDTEVVFTEDGCSVEGYTWMGTVSVNGVEAEIGTSGKAKVTSDGENVAFTNTYTPGAPLPLTGGIGTTLFTILGALLIAAAGAAFLIRGRRRRKKNLN